MNTNIHSMNKRLVRTQALCVVVVIALLILDYYGIFKFDGALGIVLPIIGFASTLSPLIISHFNVSDNFLRYYAQISMAVFIGVMGCFKGIGIYITFVLVPIASCLYFDTTYTIICSIISYFVMMLAVFFNTAGIEGSVFLEASHLRLFRAYIIGFSLEYIVVALFLHQIMRRARALLEEQHQALLAQKSQDAKYQLLMKETTDIIFEYCPNTGEYKANHSIYQEAGDKNKPVTVNAYETIYLKHPKAKMLFEEISKSVDEDKFEMKEVDLSYQKDGTIVPNWYHCESFVVRDGDKPVTVIGKMHNITAAKQLRERSLRMKVNEIIDDKRRKNSIYEQMLSETGNYDAQDMQILSAGHGFLAKLMEDVKFSDNLVDGINTMIERIGQFFNLNRICVIETDFSSGSNVIHYQWNDREDNYLVDYFTSITNKQMKETKNIYDNYGYIEVNPTEDILYPNISDNELFDDVARSVILGNQLWIPTLENGRYIGAVMFDRYDTTPYKMSEKFLISEAVNTVTTLILKINAENANRSKSDFLSTMSHEIRTPMNAIVGMTEVTLREQLPENAKKNLQTVKSSAFGLLTLINDILDYSKIESGRFDIVPEKFSLLSILNDVKEMTNARNEGKLDVEFIVPDDIPMTLYGDSVRIKQVMINYCTNAIKYSDKGRVEIRVIINKTGNDDIMLRFEVQDSGIGIRKEDIPKLFKSYTRVDTTVNHHKEGTGLGLAICKQLVELMNGNVGVESEYGKGSTFSFEIPLNVKNWEPAGRLEDYKYEDSTETNSIENTPVYAPGARVLVVDDTKINLIVAEALMSTTKMTIDKAESGEDALRMIEENDYDIVFMDHFMPGMDGVETTKRIREMENEKKANVTIVALTADAMSGVKEELLSKGMNDFLTKPIIVADLRRILRTWIPKEKLEQ